MLFEEDIHGFTQGKLYHPRLQDCAECCVEAWERMTYGGIRARYDDIIPGNIYTEIDGKAVSYPLC